MPGGPLKEIFEESLDFTSLDDMQEALGLDEEEDPASQPPRSLSNGGRISDYEEVFSEGECCCEYDENPKKTLAQMDEDDMSESTQQQRQDKEKIVAAEAVVAAINRALNRQDINSVQRGPTLPYFDAEDQMHRDEGGGGVTKGGRGYAGGSLDSDGQVVLEGGLAMRQPTSTSQHHLEVDPLNPTCLIGEEEERSRAPRLQRNCSYIYAVDSVDSAVSDGSCSTTRSSTSSAGSRRITPVRQIQIEISRNGSGHRSASPRLGSASPQLAGMVGQQDHGGLINNVRRSVSGSELKTLSSRGGGGSGGQLEGGGGGAECGEALHVYGEGAGGAESPGLPAQITDDGNNSRHSPSPRGSSVVPLGDPTVSALLGAVGRRESIGSAVVRSASFTTLLPEVGQVRCGGGASGGGDKKRQGLGFGSLSAGTSRTPSRSPSPTLYPPCATGIAAKKHAKPPAHELASTPKGGTPREHGTPTQLIRNTSLSSSFRKILRIKSCPGTGTPGSPSDDPWLDEPGSPGVGVIFEPSKAEKSRIKRVSSSISRTLKPNKMSGGGGQGGHPSVNRSLSNGQMMLVHNSTDGNGPSSGTDNVEYAALMKLFTCPGCQVLMTPPLYQCRKGHIVCVTCRHALKNCCPTCKQRFQDNTNMMMEQVCNLLKFPCRYTSEGCPLLFAPRARIDHEHFCEYRPVHCHNANKGCKVITVLKDMNNHLKECSMK